MITIYFGTEIYPAGKVPTGNWQSLDQWYSDRGYPGGKGTPDTPATPLGRFPNAATDTVYLYQNIVSNVATYNTSTSSWSSDHTYPGRIELSVWNTSSPVMSDPLAIYSGIVSCTGLAARIGAGTFYNLSVTTSGDLFIAGGTIISVTGAGGIVDLLNSGLAGIQTNTFSQFGGLLRMSLTANDTSTVPLQIGSYATPVQLWVSGVYSIARDLTIYAGGISWQGPTMLGLLRILKSTVGTAAFSDNISNYGTYSPTVTTPVTKVSGQYSINDSSVPTSNGFGLKSGTFSPTVKLSSLPVLISNIGAIIE